METRLAADSLASAGAGAACRAGGTERVDAI